MNIKRSPITRRLQIEKYTDNLKLLIVGCDPRCRVKFAREDD